MNSFSLKSMTAYGRAEVSSPLGRCSVEIQSLNRRHLEMNVHLPKQLARFEMEIRKWVKEKVVRGAVHLSIGWSWEGERACKITPQIALAKEIKRAWEAIAKEVELPISCDLLAQERELLLVEEGIEDEEEIEAILSQCVEAALLPFMQMKEREGAALGRDLIGRLGHLEKMIKKIEKEAPTAVKRMRKKLQERLEELFSGSPENEERLLREVALLAEKADITEEIVRFHSHIEQFKHLLEQKREEGKGKELDFLLQELLREINTIGSKSSEISISHAVVEIKGELEKMREQTHNIE